MAEVKDLFLCQKCGYCCQGETTVSLTEDDQKRMAAALKESADKVREKYLRITGNLVQMKIVDGHCVFYSKKGCFVHQGRPWRCAQWPLHPSILSDEHNFITISESCPGIKKEIGYRKFCDILKQLMKDGTIVC